MSGENDDELFVLRSRAYGPNPDILDDPVALNRLHDLENGERPHGVDAPPVGHEQAAPEEHRTPEAVDSTRIPSSTEGPEPGLHVRPGLRVRLGRRLRSGLSTAYRRLRQARRSTVLIGVGAVVIGFSVISAMVLVQRVQIDPLQVGATQVARLAVDTGYTTPPFFSGDEDDVVGFELFHGLRVVVSQTGFFALGGSDDEACLGVFLEADMVAARSGSFSGRALGDCAAGGFPATVQFRTDAEGYPDELRSAFPGPTALQFVYDQTDNEVVVFVATG